MYGTDGPLFGEEALDRVEEANRTDEFPRDKWSDRPVILETTSLVDLERGAVRGQAGPAMSFLDRIPVWIAATALVHNLPLVTRNVREFQRVPELDVGEY